MSQAKYSPLEPVYKREHEAPSDEEIALDTLSAAPSSPSPSPSSSPCCEADKKPRTQRSLAQRIGRCVGVLVVLGAVLWLLTGAAFVTYLGAKAHRCLHPRHLAVTELHWSPAELAELELGLVAGSLHVRSCPYAKNISLTVRTLAATDALLQTMVLEVAPLTAARGQRVVLQAPSFDWAHCQRAIFELVVPEGAALSLKAQALVSLVDVRAHSNALKDVVLASSVGRVSVQDSSIGGVLRVASELAAVSVKNVTAASLHTDLRVASLCARSITAAEVHTQVRLGYAKLAHVEAAQTVAHASELALVSLTDVAAPSLTARNDYGSLTVLAADDFAGAYSTESPFGFLAVAAAQDVALARGTETLAAMAGNVTRAEAAGARADRMTLTSTWGKIDLFFPAPATAWERAHRRAH